MSAEEAEQSGTNVAKQRNLRKKETEKEAAEREGVAASGSEDVGITGERTQAARTLDGWGLKLFAFPVWALPGPPGGQRVEGVAQEPQNTP